MLLEKAIDYGKKAGWKSIEFRSNLGFLQRQNFFSTFFTHSLDLTIGEEKIFKNLRDSTRRNINKAEKGGITLIRSNSLESARKFYNLNCMTRKHHGLPPQPWLFFKNVFYHVISPEKGFVIIALYKNIVVAGAIYFHFGKEAIYKYGASDKNYQHFRPNNLVMWEAIKWYAQNGFKSFNFGRTEPENQGLLQFKRGWGAKKETKNYYKYDLTKNCFLADQSGIKSSYKFFKHMPSTLLRLTGNLLYRHVG